MSGRPFFPSPPPPLLLPSSQAQAARRIGARRRGCRPRRRCKPSARPGARVEEEEVRGGGFWLVFFFFCLGGGRPLDRHNRYIHNKNNTHIHVVSICSVCVMGLTCCKNLFFPLSSSEFSLVFPFPLPSSCLLSNGVQWLCLQDLRVAGSAWAWPGAGMDTNHILRSQRPRRWPRVRGEGGKDGTREIERNRSIPYGSVTPCIVYGSLYTVSSEDAVTVLVT